MTIEIIAGSPRAQSVTKRVALHLQQRLQEQTDHEIGLIDLSQWQLPPLQNVFNSVANTPDEWKVLTQRVFDADAFILVSPEYNGSYSAALKNFVDHFPKQQHKVFGVATASPGPLGGMRAAQQLLLLIPGLFGIPSPYMLVVPTVDKKFDVDGHLIDDSFQNNVHNFITEYLWLAENLVKEKIH